MCGASRQPCPWKSCLHRQEGLTYSQVGGKSKTQCPISKAARAGDRQTEGKDVPRPHLSIPVVCKTQGSLCGTWSLVGTETHSGTKGKGSGGTRCCEGETQTLPPGHGKMRQRAPQGEDHSFKPDGSCGVTGSKILRGSASESVNSDGLTPKLWCGCGLWEQKGPTATFPACHHLCNCSDEGEPHSSSVNPRTGPGPTQGSLPTSAWNQAGVFRRPVS